MDSSVNRVMSHDGMRDAGRETARAVAAASAQLELALREAEGPVGQLGVDIEAMCAALESLRATPGMPDAREFDALQRRLTSAIEQLQFYDRMFQHLTQVHDYMMSVAERIGSIAEKPDIEFAPSTVPVIWERLRAKFYSRLLTEPQRQLFDLMLPPATGSCSPMRERAALGSIELF